MKRIVIIQKVLPHYRVPLFEGLKRELERRGLDFLLIYGDGGEANDARMAAQTLSWAVFRKNRCWSIFGKIAIWQPVVSLLKRNDLVVSEQATKLPLNWLLWLAGKFGLLRFGLWGHGRNFQKRGQTKEWWKERMTLGSHWFFAYTGKSAKVVRALGYPENRITVLGNSIDTKELDQIWASRSSQDRHRLRKKVGAGVGPVALYCGGLYGEKRLPFLLRSAENVRGQIKDFQLWIVGDGEEREYVESQARQHEWLHYLGPRYGREKAEIYFCADVVMNPGAVGLAILDAFTLGKPFLTTDYPYHGPEIDYLLHGVNGLMLPHDEDSFAQGVAELLNNPQLSEQMALEARKTAERFTLDNMIRNFADGLEMALR